MYKILAAILYYVGFQFAILLLFAFQEDSQNPGEIMLMNIIIRYGFISLFSYITAFYFFNKKVIIDSNDTGQLSRINKAFSTEITNNSTQISTTPPKNKVENIFLLCCFFGAIIAFAILTIIIFDYIKNPDNGIVIVFVVIPILFFAPLGLQSGYSYIKKTRGR